MMSNVFQSNMTLKNFLNTPISELMEKKPKDCNTCKYKSGTYKLHAEGGHCYMFKTEPELTYCGQYTPTPQKTKE